MRAAHREDVVKLIEYGRTLPSCGNQGDLCAMLVAAAAEIAYLFERNPHVTIEQFAQGVRTVYTVKAKEQS
jgi:hypothetical protein